MAAFLPIASPESVGISSMSINAFLNNIRNSGIELHSLMILRHGRICAQGWWKPYTPDQIHNIHSFTKTFVATAIGLLVHENRLQLDQKIVDIFPEDAPEDPSENLKKMTVWHLLTMNTGHHNDPAVRSHKNTIKAFLEAPVMHKPGTWFCYNSSASHILSRIVHKITGQTFLEYLKPRLFDPMEFGEIGFTVSSDGFPNGGGCMALTTEDMARFAQLYLNLGEWNGRQLVPADWIRTATSPQCDNSNGEHSDGNEDWEAGYGYQLWMNAPHSTYRFDGAHGQEALICPDQDMAIICTASTRNLAGLLHLAWRFILNNCQDHALPENPIAHEQLSERLTDLALPETLDLGSSWLQKLLHGSSITVEGEFRPFIRSVFGQIEAGTDVTVTSLTPVFTGDDVTLTMNTSSGSIDIRAGMRGTPIVNELFGSTVHASAQWRETNQLVVTWRSLRAVNTTEFTLSYTDGHLELISRNPLNGDHQTAIGILQ